MNDSARSDPFEAVWQEVVSAWSDEAAHRKFIAFCASQGALAEAGKRYRRVREEDPDRAKQAARWIDAVLAAAMENMQLMRGIEEPAAQARPLKWLAFALSSFLIVYALLVLLRSAPH